MTAAARLNARLEPIAYEDDGTLQNLTTAWMSPVEICEIARDQGALVAWESLTDPDTCPPELLDWLAIYNGVELPPSALTADEKRYRIKQAAGRYRGTPRALVEEIQIVLDQDSDQTVLLGYNNGDEWHYIVGTIDAETPNEAAVAAAIERQNPAFMIAERILTSDWTSFVLAPTLIAVRDEDGNYSIGTPAYPTCQSVLDAFATCQDLLDNNPI